MRYEILKDFRGSQDGTKTEYFKKGATVELSKYLASCAPRDSIKAISEISDVNPKVDTDIKNKAIATSGKNKGKK